MRRTFVNMIAAIFFAFALARTIWQPLEWPMLLGAGLFALGCLFERWRYRPPTDAVPSCREGWTATGERFVDPESGRLVSVWYHAATGARRYIDVNE